MKKPQPLLRAAKSGAKNFVTALAGNVDNLDEVAKITGKSVDEVARIVEGLKAAGHIDDAGRIVSLADDAAEGGKLASQAMMSDLYKEFGKGGVKWAGIPLGGESLTSGAGFKGKEIFRALPGSRWAEQAFGM
ncbi:MAG: hypothetical protein HGB11_07235, partial [Chlorobiales bacterium]|nr:hypothetical protein [Chlorobiales bacterium]